MPLTGSRKLCGAGIITSFVVRVPGNASVANLRLIGSLLCLSLSGGHPTFRGVSSPAWKICYRSAQMSVASHKPIAAARVPAKRLPSALHNAIW